jgi:hypothetical protein
MIVLYVYFLRYRWSPAITFWRVTAFIDIAWTANQHEINLFKWLMDALLQTVRL